MNDIGCWHQQQMNGAKALGCDTPEVDIANGDRLKRLLKEMLERDFADAPDAEAMPIKSLDADTVWRELRAVIGR